MVLLASFEVDTNCRLETSRALRVLWLAIELDLNYEIIPYHRTKKFRAPEELQKIHPLGKSPIVEIYQEGRLEPIVLTETGYIMEYLVEHYDKEGKYSFVGERGELSKYYLHYSEGTLQPLLVGIVVNLMAVKHAFAGIRFMVHKITDRINSEFYFKEVFQNLDYLESNLSKVSGDYFTGEEISPADIILSFPIHENLFSSKERLRIPDIDERYPNLSKWSKLIAANHNYLKANEEFKKQLNSNL